MSNAQRILAGEAARILGVSLPCLHSYDGDLEPLVVGARAWRIYDRARVVALAERRAAEAAEKRAARAARAGAAR